LEWIQALKGVSRSESREPLVWAVIEGEEWLSSLLSRREPQNQRGVGWADVQKIIHSL
jgi:hypothetical protein